MMAYEFQMGPAVVFVLLGFFLLHLLSLCGRRRNVRIVAGKGSSGALPAENGGEADVIVVGAGVAGSALAYALGKDGRRVHVIERDLSEPDRIVGELLQPGGYLKLLDLGLEDCVEDIDAQQIFGYALFKDGKSVKLAYPSEHRADVAGRCFHNGRFIQRMRQKAASLSNVELEQGTVTSLIEEHGTAKGVAYRTKSGEQNEAFAALTIVCDGCCSNLRRQLCCPKIEVISHSMGLVLENAELPFPNHVHLIFGDPSVIVLYPISSTEIRCLVDVPRQNLPDCAPKSADRLAAYMKTVVVPQVPTGLRAGFLAAVDGGNSRSTLNRSMPAAVHCTPGAFLLGDAFNIRHPLTGGGMTVALSDVVLLRDLLRPVGNLRDTAALSEYLESFHTLRKPVASTINILAGVLYEIVSGATPPDQAMNELIKQAIFDYLSLQEEFSSGPLACFSGLNPRPLTLLAHFLASTVYAVGQLLIPVPSLYRLWTGARMLSGVAGTVFPIVKAEGLRQVFFPASVPACYRAPPV